jgi:hypothetical protein
MDAGIRSLESFFKMMQNPRTPSLVEIALQDGYPHLASPLPRLMTSNAIGYYAEMDNCVIPLRQLIREKTACVLVVLASLTLMSINPNQDALETTGVDSFHEHSLRSRKLGSANRSFAVKFA